MVGSLRSLCLLKVNRMRRQGFKFTDIDIPVELVRDLNLARLFNGTFAFAFDYEGCDSKVLTICYDGESWTFYLYYWCQDQDCYWCQYHYSPAIKFTMTEGDTATLLAMSYFSNNMKRYFSWLRNSEHSEAPPQDHFLVKMKVKVSVDNWRVGRLVFTGPCFREVWRVNMDREGNRVLSQHAVGLELGNHEYIDEFESSRLEETREEWDWDDEVFRRYEVSELQLDSNMQVIEENNFRDFETFAEWEIVEEGWLKDFWEGVDVSDH